MKCRTLTFVFAAAVLPAPFLTAVADESIRYGLMPGISQFSVDDPDGGTDPTQEFNPFNAILANDFGRDSRVLSQVYYQPFTLDAGVTTVGQEVSRGGVAVSWQGMLRIARAWKPWVGVGLGYSQDSFKKRYTVDKDGFLAARYANRKESAVNLILNASTEWQWTRDWDIGFHVQYETPLEGSTQALSVSVMLLY